MEKTNFGKKISVVVHFLITSFQNSLLYALCVAVLSTEYNGNITVPCLWDKINKTIVNNESSEIIRMLTSEFNAFCKTEEQKKLDLYPENLRQQIDVVNDWVYP